MLEDRKEYIAQEEEKHVPGVAGPEGPGGPRPPHPPHGPEGPGGPRPPHPPHGPEGPGGPRPPHPPHSPRIDWKQYEVMDTEEKLLAMLRVLGHADRLHFDGRGGQSRALKLLREDVAMTQRELTERLGIQPGSASELVGKLERAGLIVRTPSETDRRTADIRLTQAGAASQAERAGAEKSGTEELFSALTGEERKALLELLEKLYRSWSERADREPT